jgi:tRNA(Ile)-lysidine synthase
VNLQNFRQILIQKCGIDPTKPVLAGISGGPDSLCLLHLLHQCGINTIAAHLDHSLRPTSAKEADYVAKLCADACIPLVRHRVDATEYSARNHLAIEEGARILRYEFLFREAEEAGAQAVLVAHHADDQVETVLMHLMRGSGLSGLAGMRMVLVPNPWSGTIPLVRPLLFTWREEIEEYCRIHQLEPVQDDSNLDTRYYRNRIRHELIPVLKTYNPLVKERLQKMSSVVGQEDELLRLLTDQAWTDVLLQQADRFIELRREEMRVLHPALMRRVMRKAILMLNRSLRDIEFDCVERGVGFILKSNRSNQEVLCAGISIFNYLRDRLLIAFDDDRLDDLWPQMPSNPGIPLPEEGEVRINAQWVIQIETTVEKQPGKDAFSCLVDAGKLMGELKVDTARPGERFMPYGMNGKTKKLGDFWTSEGLPARARKLWPLVYSGSEIIWVPGFRIAEPVKVTAKSQKVLQIKLIKK